MITTIPDAPDYWAVYKPGRLEETCIIHAHSGARALRVARRNGFRLPRGSYARRIGRDGYAAILRRAGLLSRS